MRRRPNRPRAKWREALIIEHLSLVRATAKKVLWRLTAHGNHFAILLDEEDLEGSGYVGLCQAADRFQPRMGSFAPFALFRVRGAMLDSVKRRAWREGVHESIEAMEERLGAIPAHLSTDPAPLPDVIAIDSQRRRLVREAIDELPSSERKVLQGHLAGESVRETAVRTGICLTWTRQKLQSAQQLVTEALKEAA